MAASDYGPEIKASMSKPSMKPHVGGGGKPRIEPMRAGAGPKTPPDPQPAGPTAAPRIPVNTAPPRIAEQAPSNPNHILAAASIAHAILGNRGAGGGM